MRLDCELFARVAGGHTPWLDRGLPLLSRTVGRWVAESEIAEFLGDTERAHEGVAIGSYPFFRDGRTGANFVVRATERELLDACADALAAGLAAQGLEVVEGGI